MAIGLIPHYSVVFTLEELTNEEFLIIIREVAEKLDWKVTKSDLTGMIAYTKFRKRSVNEKIQINIEEKLITLKSESLEGQFFDFGRNKRNTEKFIACYDELRTSISADELKVKTGELQEELSSADEPALAENSITIHADEKTKGILSLLIPVKGYYITPLIIDINILIFLLMVISGVNVILPNSENLLSWGANFRPLTLAGQPWRLLTNCFLHIGIFHLLFNMYALLYIGILLEPRLGSWRFGITYVITGIIASVTSLYMHEMTISAGASGAIFGMYGVFLAMLTTNLIEKSIRKALLGSIVIFVGYNILNGLNGNIDNAAHIGGLVSGILIGYSFYPGLMKLGDKKLELGLPVVLIAALLVFSSWEYNRIPKDIVEYQEGMKKFSTIERKALTFYNKQRHASGPLSTGELLAELKDTGLVYWQEGKQLILKLDNLNIPSQLHERNGKLITYCDLRINCFQLMYESIRDSTREYNSQIRDYNYSIDSLIKTLK
jgi:rhomboid protease GluP